MRRGREYKRCWAVILACFSLRLACPVTFVPASLRRSAVVGALLGSLSWNRPAAAGPSPEYVLISSMPAPHSNADGYWQKNEKELNKMATYKSMSEDLFLMLNDCGEFQLGQKITGDCTGFARQQGKGVWLVDGKKVEGQVKFKPAQAPGAGFKPGAAVEVIREFVSNDDEKEALKNGWKGVVVAIDSQGDAEIDFEKSASVHFVLKKNYLKLKLA